MKYTYHHICPICERRGLDSRQEFVLLISDSENDYKIKCKRGHVKTVIYTDEKYNMLFASAMDCIQQGHLREAIANLAASYERLLEYAIKIICLKNKVEQSKFIATWKFLKNQSERQMGGFSLLYLQTFKELPPLFREDNISFRNSVIHKGFYPTYKEVVDFSVITFELMIEIIYQLNKKCKAAIKEYSKQTRLDIEKKRTPNGMLSLIRIGSPLDLDFAEVTAKPNSNAIKRQLERWKKQFSNIN
jgi:hypothetical protein